MFRALTYPSSGGKIVFTQHLVSSLSVHLCTVHWLRADCSRSAASPAEIVGSNPTGGMNVCCECCVLSGRGLCDGLITLPEESYRLWRVVVFDQETSKTRRLKLATGIENTTTMGCNARKTNKQTNKPPHSL